MGQDIVQIERAELRRIALRQHERRAYGGTFVPNGGSCLICKGEWTRDKPEVHALTCPLYFVAPSAAFTAKEIALFQKIENGIT